MTATDLELLRQYEPVIRYTRGESFFPMDVGLYVRDSSLWVQPPGRPATQIASQGELNLEKLAQVPNSSPTDIQYLKFIEPLELREMIAGSELKNCLFFSNHASNYFPVQARLPHDRESLLQRLDVVLKSRDRSQLRPESSRGL